MTVLPDWLDTFPRLKAVDDPAWIDVAGRVQEVVIPANMTVFKGGDTCRHFILVLAGAIRVHRVFESGREIVLCHLQAGQCCSLTTSILLAGGCYTANAMTEAETKAVLIPRSDFNRAFDVSRGFRNYVCAEFSDRFHDMLLLLETIAMRNVEVRLARWLLDNRSDTGSVKASHRELACELGTAREVVSRHLKDFEKKGLVKLSRKYIELADVTALNARVSGPHA